MLTIEGGIWLCIGITVCIRSLFSSIAERNFQEASAVVLALLSGGWNLAGAIRRNSRDDDDDDDGSRGSRACLFSKNDLCAEMLMISILMPSLSMVIYWRHQSLIDYVLITTVLSQSSVTAQIGTTAVLTAMGEDSVKILLPLSLILQKIVKRLWASSLRESLTFGEYEVICTLQVVVMIWFIDVEVHQDGIRHQEAPLDVTMVSVSGLFGCILSSLFAWLISSRKPDLLKSSRVLWYAMLSVQIVGPLLAVELALSRRESVNRRDLNLPFIDMYLPTSIAWLFSFLQETEGRYPRYYGLVHWAVVLALAWLPTMKLLYDKSVSPVLTRKWFHLIALLLFLPVTLLFPDLMSLAYAVATCVLLILEVARHDWPSLNSFYVTFIDVNKEDATNMVVSHIFLILGCALPLWIGRIIDGRGTEIGVGAERLLSLWGVLSVGIGDAMGAVIGVIYGKNKWGKNSRTLEGSFAMSTSMTVVGTFLVDSLHQWIALSISTSIVTLLEAHTMHMDNIVLPLAGVIVLLAVFH